MIPLHSQSFGEVNFSNLLTFEAFFQVTDIEPDIFSMSNFKHFYIWVTEEIYCKLISSLNTINVIHLIVLQVRRFYFGSQTFKNP